MRRIVRGRRLTAEEAAKYRKIRSQIEQEKPEIEARIRARMDDAGLKAAMPNAIPVELCTATVSPLSGSPSTRAIAPENIHGWRVRTDFSRPGFRMMVFMLPFIGG